MQRKMTSYYMLALSVLISTSFYCINTPEEHDTDTIAPILSLPFKADTILIGEPWANPGVSVSDNIDKNLASQVTVSGKVQNEKCGMYALCYSVKDNAGNIAQDTLRVHVIPDQSTVAYYPFSGDVKDYSGNALDGTISGADSLAVDRFGVPANARRFKAGYINVPYTTKLDFPGAFTACAWAKSDQPGSSYSTSEGFILNMGFGAERDYGIYASSSGVSFRYNLKIINYSSIDIQKWHHYVMVFNGDTLKAFVDAVQVGAISCKAGSIDDNPLRIGCESKQTGRYWYGLIDDVQLVNSALSYKRMYELTQAGGFVPETVTNPIDTPVVPDTSGVIKNLKATISGVSGTLALKLTWDNVPGALAYGVYYNTGKRVTKNDYYRVATANSKTLTTELTEGTEYSFAVVAIVNNEESPLSQAVTVVFKP